MNKVCGHTIKNEHDASRDSKQWNCNDCGFESTTSTPLMNHCKKQGHQPSKTVQDGRGNLITCNNCQQDFTSFWNLMNHRKLEHPSNRKCRDFAIGACLRGDLCWYVHENVMELSSQNSQVVPHQGEDKIQCYICKKEFSSKNEMMNHKKREHPSNIVCKNFCLGNCRRSEEQGWYLHKIFPGGVSSQYVTSNNQNALSQSRQTQKGSSPDGSLPSVVTSNQNSLPQTTQTSSTLHVSPTSVSPQSTSPTVLNNLLQPRQTPSPPQVLPHHVSPNIQNNLPQTQQDVLFPGFQLPPMTPAPPEVSVIMLQFTQMMQRMEKMENNFQMLLQQTNLQKFLST